MIAPIAGYNDFPDFPRFVDVYILPAIRCIGLCTSPLLSVVMLPRRSSTVPSIQVVPPTSGSFRRPSGIATNQQTFHAYTAGTLETESPQSGSQRQAIPPQSQTFPQLPPGSGGLRRKSTRLNTYDTYADVLEEHVPASSQPPSIMPIPSPPFSQVSGHPAPAPMRPQQPALGGGVGGFAVATPFHHDPSRNDPRHNTSDYNNRFDTMASARSDSSPPQYEPVALTGDIHAEVWPTYNRVSKEFDDKMLEKTNSDLDVLLIFVSLVFGRDC